MVIRPIDGSTIERQLSKNGNRGENDAIPLEPRITSYNAYVISGPIDLTKRIIPEVIEFTNCQFSGALILRNARIRALVMNGCTCMKQIDLTNLIAEWISIKTLNYSAQQSVEVLIHGLKVSTCISFEFSKVRLIQH